MATIKIIKDVELVYSAETIQGKIELDGEIVEFRYAQDTKANISFYILVNDKWETKFDDKYNIIFDSCQSTEINKDSKSGEEWDAEEEEE